MKKLDYYQIGMLQFLVDKKMDALETAIANNRTSPFTELSLSEYNEIDSILKDMKKEVE